MMMPATSAAPINLCPWLQRSTVYRCRPASIIFLPTGFLQKRQIKVPCASLSRSLFLPPLVLVTRHFSPVFPFLFLRSTILTSFPPPYFPFPSHPQSTRSAHVIQRCGFYGPSRPSFPLRA